ncbi:MAG TPA: EamA family transporter [Candidatus Paceibacterota bacterium]|nr:EamA family transporter [Candidatus Pacearchaeota archaeon]HRZ50812.1 EamA family transporter [Candidatus Paceibacterota bacterium]HSA36533.1 EamA family transporter [Candidatus Paceibacterota bacterium]
MWFLYALGSGFLNAVSTALSKKALREIDVYTVPLAMTALALPFFLIAITAGEKWATPAPLFWPALAASGAINVLASILMMKALKTGDLSLTVPYLAFTPLFLTVTSKLILNESISAAGFAGIILITIGACALQWTEKKGFVDSFRNFAKNRASQYALTVALLYSISTNFDKMGIVNSNAFIYPAAIYAFQALFFLPIAIARKKTTKKAIIKNWKYLLPIGPVSAGILLLYSAAISAAMVAYVIALKRTVVLWSVLIGYYAFNEKNFLPKIAGATAMVFGVFLIAMG